MRIGRISSRAASGFVTEYELAGVYADRLAETMIVAHDQVTS